MIISFSSVDSDKIPEASETIAAVAFILDSIPRPLLQRDVEPYFTRTDLEPVLEPASLVDEMAIGEPESVKSMWWTVGRKQERRW